MLRVDVKPELLRWARERADLSIEALAKQFPKLGAWERGAAKPTLKQLEDYARATFAPFGYFFLAAPPEEPMPIPDLRTIGNARLSSPSPNLLDTIYLCQQRQDWYRDHVRAVGEESLEFVGSARADTSIVKTAAAMRNILGFDLEQRRTCPTWTDALRLFLQQADSAGVLVMCSGVVLNNTRRRLDPQEFRGFALSDDLAPLVFVNGADTKAAQMFTLAHELAHVWLGKSALSDAEASSNPADRIERWCNQVAAELLVPLSVFREELRTDGDLAADTQRLARRFKVSTLVVLRRMHDAGRLSEERLRQAYHAELERLGTTPRGAGGDFYLTQTARVGRRFARALIESTLEGRTLFLEAHRMLGIRKAETFNGFGRSLGYDL